MVGSKYVHVYAWARAREDVVYGFHFDKGVDKINMQTRHITNIIIPKI